MNWRDGQTTAYRVIVEGKPRQLNPAIRDEVYRIGREGLVNAFRHSGATAVEIEIDYTPGELRMFVRDDGRASIRRSLRSGTAGHWGITGMKERAERIGGSLTIRSRAVGRAPKSNCACRHGPHFSHGSKRTMSDDNPIRVLSADDHALLREGIAAVINAQPDMVDGRAGVDRP